MYALGINIEQCEYCPVVYRRTHVGDVSYPVPGGMGMGAQRIRVNQMSESQMVNQCHGPSHQVPYPNNRKLVVAIIVITVSATKRKCIMSGSIKTSVPERESIMKRKCIMSGSIKTSVPERDTVKQQGRGRQITIY